MQFNHPNKLSAQGGFTERDRIKLQRFISGLRVVTTTHQGQNPRAIKKVTGQGAQNVSFKTREGASMTVAVCNVFVIPRRQLKVAKQQYFRTTYRKNLEFPQVPCVEVGLLCFMPLRSHSMNDIGWRRSTGSDRSLHGAPWADHEEAGPSRKDQGCPPVFNAEAPCSVCYDLSVLTFTTSLTVP
jgi:hypothetical protein